ncbi:hypothetical protein L208DRAFT_1409361 [Tricholoma matsutake]|nr:hypothetical protein L208DRAFT_1416729 [Tricholoma matsutake 945]KAF8224870.1 hypothetical protein L208DRAFT_1409361 [Tricholoma matsutake 945]
MTSTTTNVNWTSRLLLTGEYVWDAFFLHSLLVDATERGAVLGLAHVALDQAERLRPA